MECGVHRREWLKRSSNISGFMQNSTRVIVPCWIMDVPNLPTDLSEY